jgi:glycerol-3-phosphate dehydrogenase
VISSYVGVRPLIADPNGKPSDISRTHEIQQSAPGWWDVAGGKLTTYRLMAEQTIDQVARFLGGRFENCVTAKRTLLGQSATNGISSIVPPEPSRELVEHFCRSEWAQSLEDVMRRRTSWSLYRRDLAEVRMKVADWMTELLGWNAQQRDAELRWADSNCI